MASPKVKVEQINGSFENFNITTVETFKHADTGQDVEVVTKIQPAGISGVMQRLSIINNQITALTAEQTALQSIIKQAQDIQLANLQAANVDEINP